MGWQISSIISDEYGDETVRQQLQTDFVGNVFSNEQYAYGQFPSTIPSITFLHFANASWLSIIGHFFVVIIMNIVWIVSFIYLNNKFILHLDFLVYFHCFNELYDKIWK